MEQYYRTHFADELTKDIVGQEVTVNGWVQRRRDLGGLIFIDLRDRTGIIQVVFNPEISKEAIQIADQIRSEYVVAVKGKVIKRSEETINPKIKTGEIEIQGEELFLFNSSKTPPFPIEDRIDVDEMVRLKYRYLDLRREKLQRTLIMRHQAMQVIRRFLDQQGFLEIETPMMTKSTPEGARDYLIPSRFPQGEFYALPQSPQLFKQLLMVSGYERYFQITKCFRDEDLRSDRQPEFTQIDLEASFLTRDTLLHMMEEMFVTLFKEVLDVNLETPFPRFTYQEVMERFGTDKPDLRFGMELVDLSDVLSQSSFQVFSKALATGGQVKAINVKGAAHWSRKEIDRWGEVAISLGAKGLAWIAMKGGSAKGPIAKFLTEEELKAVQEKTKAEAGDLLFFAADQPQMVAKILGELRVKLGEELQLVDPDEFSFLWVTDFPMFEYDEEERRYQAMHHPFTMPRREDLPLLTTDPSKVRAVSEDLVLNGYELSSGSQRIHERDVQEKIFQVLEISKEEAKQKFGFLLEAFEYGAPPHGGMAFGFDRLMMLMAGHETIRECIAFPKTANAKCVMTDAPSSVEASQLEELGIRVKRNK